MVNYQLILLRTSSMNMSLLQVHFRSYMLIDTQNINLIVRASLVVTALVSAVSQVFHYSHCRLPNIIIDFHR